MALVLAAPRSGRADARAPAVTTPRLDWVRAASAESCASGAELTAQLRQHGLIVGAGEGSGPAALEGWVERRADGAGFRARVRVFEASDVLVGERTVETRDPDCAALTPSVLLVLRLLLGGASESQAAVEPAAPQTEVHDGDGAAATALASPSDDPAPVSSAEPRWQGRLWAAVGLASGVNPRLTFGPRVGVEVDSPWGLGAYVQGSYWVRGDQSLPGDEAAPSQASFRALQADVALCARSPRLARVTVLGCWGAFVGSHFVSTFGWPRTDGCGGCTAGRPSPCGCVWRCGSAGPSS